MPVANFLAMVLGFVIAAAGVLGISAPSVLLEFGRSLQSASALYAIAALRVVFGTILVWAAPNSRTPRILRILGIFIIVAGVLTPFFGAERSRAMLVWWSTQGPLFMRTWAIVAVGFGLFIAYTASPRGSGA